MNNLLAYLPSFPSTRAVEQSPPPPASGYSSSLLSFRHRTKDETFQTWRSRVKSISNSVAEFVHTENRYADNLAFVDKTLGQPILKDRVPLTDESTREVFKEFFELWHSLSLFHADAQQHLRDNCLKETDADARDVENIRIDAAEKLAQTLVILFGDSDSEVMKTYVRFTTSYLLVLKLFTVELNRNKQFQKLSVFSQRGSTGKSPSVDGRLLAPIRRLTVYPLLLSPLLSVLTESEVKKELKKVGENIAHLLEVSDKEIGKARQLLEIANVNARLRMRPNKKGKKSAVLEEERLLGLMDNEDRKVYSYKGVYSLGDTYSCFLFGASLGTHSKLQQRALKKRLERRHIILFNDILIITKVVKSIFRQQKIYQVLYTLPLSYAVLVPKVQTVIKDGRKLFCMVLSSRLWGTQGRVKFMVGFKQHPEFLYWRSQVKEALQYATENPESVNGLHEAEVFSTSVVLNKGVLEAQKRGSDNTILRGTQLFVDENRAATKLQRSFRNVRSRRLAKKRRKEMVRAAVVIQRAQRHVSKGIQ